MATMQHKRGPSSNITSLILAEGEPAYTLDTHKFYIGNPDGTKTLINPDALPVESVGKLTTPRDFSISGDGTATAVPFDGQQNVNLVLVLAATGVAAGTYTKLTIDAKGRVISASQISAADVNLGNVDNVKQASKAEFDAFKSAAAPLASPAFTGTPTAPTASSSTNNTQIATTAFVKAAITALINSSPAALDTLQELAAALGNDPNFATTITTALAAKAPLASPGLTGTPTAPTAASSANSTQIATTAFVKAQGYLTSGSVIDGGTF